MASIVRLDRYIVQCDAAQVSALLSQLTVVVVPGLVIIALCGCFGRSRTLTQVGDQSEYVTQIHGILSEDVGMVAQMISPRYLGFYCNQVRAFKMMRFRLNGLSLAVISIFWLFGCSPSVSVLQ